MVKPLVIYHGGCDDGFGAAFAVALALEDVELYPGVYNKPPPDVAQRDVILVDFSYKRPVLEEMAASARSILILDHHKTALEDLAGFGLGAKATRTHAEWVGLNRAADEAGYGKLPARDSVLIAALFDMGRSGAGIAWDFFHPHGPRPLWVDYLEDRDLWRKKLPEGDAFTFALRSYPQTVECWRSLFGTYTASTRGRRDVEKLIAEGRPILRYYRRKVDELKLEAYEAVVAIDGGDDQTTIRACNAPYAFASEVAGEIAPPGSFGACYFRRADGRWQYSLRSRDGFDVSAFAKMHGGGGHAAAAGFDVAEPVHVRAVG